MKATREGGGRKGKLAGLCWQEGSSRPSSFLVDLEDFELLEASSQPSGMLGRTLYRFPAHEDVVISPDQSSSHPSLAVRAQTDFLPSLLFLFLQNEIKNKIALATNSPASGSGSPDATRRSQLKAELDGLRGQQAETKGKRGKILDELKKVREDVGKKVRLILSSESVAGSV